MSWRHPHSMLAGFALGAAAAHNLVWVAALAVVGGVAGALLVAAARAGLRRLRARRVDYRGVAVGLARRQWPPAAGSPGGQP